MLLLHYDPEKNMLKVTTEFKDGKRFKKKVGGVWDRSGRQWEMAFSLAKVQMLFDSFGEENICLTPGTQEALMRLADHTDKILDIRKHAIENDPIK